MKEKSIYLKIKDYSVSGEEFQLLYNNELEMLETYPQPTLDKLPEYYKSEDYISHTDSKRNIFEIVYQHVKSIALKQKIKRINKCVTTDRSLLDVGCGTGDFLKIALEHHWKVTGIEPNLKARTIANTKTNNVIFDTNQLFNFKPNSFDVITLWHVLEHLPDLEKHLSVFNSILKENGTLIIAVPNFQCYDAKYYKSFWAAYDVPRHLWHFSKKAMTKLVEKQFMKVDKIYPMIFDAYYVSLLSEKYKTGFMNPFKAFWVASVSNFKAKRNNNYSSLIYSIKKLEK
jgi:2-polyprenyl-3-methyl-5-hydroxy-6-metoxy-1,4-benzoquinol methylase